MRTSAALAVAIFGAALFVAAAFPRADRTSASATQTPRGVLTGAIREVGGPQGVYRFKRGGLATAFNMKGRVFARQHVRAGHDFTFRLSPGTYHLGYGRHGTLDRAGCPRTAVVVRAGRRTHSDLLIGCSWR